MAHLTHAALLQWLGTVLVVAASAVVLGASLRAVRRERPQRRAREQSDRERSP